MAKLSLDSLAKKAAPASKSKTTKVAAKVTDEIKGKVDLIIHHKAAIKSLEAEQADAETSVIDHVRPQQDELAFAGSYSNSFSVEGNTGSLTFVAANKWIIPKDEAAQEELRALLGKNFDQCFENKREVKLNAEAAEAILDKIDAALTAAGMSLATVLSVTDTLVAKPDLDEKVYHLLDAKKLAIFRTLCKQYKPALK